LTKELMVRISIYWDPRLTTLPSFLNLPVAEPVAFFVFKGRVELVGWAELWVSWDGDDIAGEVGKNERVLSESTEPEGFEGTGVDGGESSTIWEPGPGRLIVNDVVPGENLSLAVALRAGSSKVFVNSGVEFGPAWGDVDCWAKLVVNPDELAELVGIGGTMEGEGFISTVKGS
jgi:hypothetical protein